MKLKKILLLTSVISSFTAYAEKKISYNWLEIDAGFNKDIGVLKLEGSKSLSDNFYITANASRGYKEHSRLNISNDRFDRTIFSGLLGFTTNMSKRTDFYTELGVEYSKATYPVLNLATGQLIEFDISDYNPLLKLGTRTKFNEKFELITSVSFVNNDYPNIVIGEIDYNETINPITAYKFDSHDVDFTIKGLYNVTDKSSLTFGLSSSDKDGFASIGWRKNW